MLNWLWGFIRPYGWQLCAALMALVVTAGTTLAMGQGVRLLIDNGFAQASHDGLRDALMFFMALVVTMSIGAYCRFYLISWIGERVIADIRQVLYRHLITLPPSFFEDNLAGEIQSRITTDTTLIQSVIGSSLSFALRNTLVFIGGMVLMVYTNFKLTLIVLAAVPLVVLPLVVLGRTVKSLSKDSQDKIANVGAWTGESLQHIQIVQAFTREEMVAQKFELVTEGAFRVAVKRIQKRAILIALVLLLVMGAVTSMLYVGGNDVLAGELSGGDLAAFVFYAIMVGMAFAAVTEVYGEVQRAAGAAERIRELIDTKVEIESPEHSVILEKISGDLRLDNITFNYPSRPDSNAIEGLSLDIKSGEHVALVGPSGAGKSTIFELLLRFRDPQQGEVFLDGVPLKQLSLDQLRNQFALVPQQPVLFSANVLDNLRYGNPEATEAEVMSAAKMAHANEFIKQLPEGYQSFLGEQGVKLSGGQRQRLAIARAILRDPKILLLDEATSALDANSERWVQEALNKLMENRTTIIIAHRLATVVHADRIAVMDHGKIVAIGTHKELLQSSPLYKELAELQFHTLS